MVEFEVHSVMELQRIIKAKLEEVEKEGLLIIPSANNAQKWFQMRIGELKQLIEDAKPLCVFTCERCGWSINRHY